MSDNIMVGDADGIKLWNMMAVSSDKSESAYFITLSSAATKYGEAWFCDTVTQKQERRNQTFWKIAWSADDARWVVSLFHIPDGVNKASQRIVSHGIDETPIELSYEDLISEV